VRASRPSATQHSLPLTKSAPNHKNLLDGAELYSVYKQWTIGDYVYITIDERDKRPIYQQVVDEIKALIARGELEERSSLPPVRQIAADLGVNQNTIAFAYRQLQKEGLIRVKHGSGAVVVSRVLAKRDQERAHEQLQAVLTDLVLAGLTRSEVLALVNNALNSLGERGRRN
jgi:GntR family transcriptional regulator